MQRVIWRPTVRHYDLSVQCALGIGCFDSLLSMHPVEEREFGTVKCCAGTLGDRVLLNCVWWPGVPAPCILFVTRVRGTAGRMLLFEFRICAVIAENAEQALILRSSAKRCVSKDGGGRYFPSFETRAPLRIGLSEKSATFRADAKRVPQDEGRKVGP